MVCRLSLFLAIGAITVFFTSCERTKDAPKDRAIAQAFIGPITLNIRQEISPASKPIATARHGEKVDVIQVRRRFVRIRTPRDEEGWTDSRNLLTAEQMDGIAELAKAAAALPSQGEATVFSPLNVHTDPHRLSTSFFQVSESNRVDVLAHQLVPKSGSPPPVSFQVPKPAPPVRVKKPPKEPKLPPPARPPAPGLPSNWLELSKTNLPVEEPVPPPPQPDEKTRKKRRKSQAPKTAMEDWYLVRAKDGKAGWVLARMLNMAIPDEVAQYSEGARITSYFALGDVYDDGQKKHHWLWTTSRDGQQPYQFDSFRIFTYVLRKHRYETAYIERDVEGYYPIEAIPGKIPKFSLIFREADGQLYRKTYIMEGYLVRKIADVPYTATPQEPGSKVISTLPASGDDKDEKEELSLGERIRALFKRTGS
jgi:uncharacterized protein YgiM (DUF1202 family)